MHRVFICLFSVFLNFFIGCSSRPDEGLDAINTLSQGLLGHFSHSMFEVIQALAALGYDPTRLHAMPYDFRLTPDLLETRDGYFSNLKAKIELEKKRTKKRAVVLAHSLGCKIFAYFLAWLHKVIFHGDKGNYHTWMDSHVGLYFANGNPLLGSPDIATSIIVGAQQGMPVALKYIHEVLASAGGILALAPTTLEVGGGTTAEKPPPHLRDDVPWIKVAHPGNVDGVLEAIGSHGEFGPDVCNDTNRTTMAAVRFFRDVGAQVGDTQLTTIGAFVRRLCEDPFVGDVYRVGVSRPPIDAVHVAYGVGLPTRLSTTFELTPTRGVQTPPYFAEAMDREQLEKYDMPSRTWVVSGYVEEVGTHERVLVDATRRIVADSHAPGKSGDDTVPYVSLSAAHRWLGDSKVSVGSVPLRKKFLADEVKVGEYDPIQRAMKKDHLLQGRTCTAGDDAKKCLTALADRDDEPRLTVFESTHVDDLGAATRTTVMELEGVSHRGSANHPVYIDHLTLVLVDHILKNKYHGGVVTEEDLRSDDVATDLSATLFEAQDFIPTDDSDCFWSFTNAACAYPGICEYQYRVGDLYLSQSCRLKHSVHLTPGLGPGSSEL